MDIAINFLIIPLLPVLLPLYGALYACRYVAARLALSRARARPGDVVLVRVHRDLRNAVLLLPPDRPLRARRLFPPNSFAASPGVEYAMWWSVKDAPLAPIGCAGVSFGSAASMHELAKRLLPRPVPVRQLPLGVAIVALSAVGVVDATWADVCRLLRDSEPDLALCAALEGARAAEAIGAGYLRVRRPFDSAARVVQRSWRARRERRLSAAAIEAAAPLWASWGGGQPGADSRAQS